MCSLPLRSYTMGAPSKKVILSVFTLLLGIEGSMSVNTFESMPPTENGILTACAGQQISLTCSHNNTVTATTRWIASPPVNCTMEVGHQGSSPTASACGPFMFQGITPVQPPLLNSTAIANATTNMTGTNIECIGGNAISSFSVGSISLCVADPPSPPTNLTCENITNGLNVSWEAVDDTSCNISIVEYRITVIREHDMNTIKTMATPETAAELIGPQILEPETTYIISVGASILMRSCFGEDNTVLCETSPSLPTQPPATMAESSQSSTSPSGPTTASLSTGAIVGIAIGVIIIVILVIVIMIVIIVIIKKPRDGKDGTDQGVHAPLANDVEQQQLPLYAMVDKSQKTVAEQPTYQDPSSIQHETAPTGDVYAITDKKQKKEATEAELAQMYSVPDKTKGGGLNYASLNMPAGDGSEARRPAPTEYATVINY